MINTDRALQAELERINQLYGTDSAAACDSLNAQLGTWIEYVEQYGGTIVRPARPTADPSVVTTRYQADLDYKAMRDSWDNGIVSNVQ